MAMLKSFNQQATHRYKLQTGTSKENMLEFKRITSVSILQLKLMIVHLEVIKIQSLGQLQQKYTLTLQKRIVLFGITGKLQKAADT